jgi:hypothetical protein
LFTVLLFATGAGSDLPTREEMTGEMTGLPPQLVQVLVQVQQSSPQKSSINCASSVIPSISVQPSVSEKEKPTSSGSAISSQTVELLTRMAK